MENITREQAANWLAKTKGIHQRRVREDAVARYAKDMTLGRWASEVCPPILIDVASGAVINGQHRLRAFLSTDDDVVFESDVKVTTLDNIVVMDTGPGRSLDDTLAVLGYDNSKYVAAHYRAAQVWATGFRRAISRSDQINWIENNPNTAKAAEAARRLESIAARKAAVMRIATGANALLWDIGEYAEGGDTYEDWATQLLTGKLGTPEAGRLITTWQNHRNPRTKSAVSTPDLALLVARVYLAHLDEETVTKLYARRPMVRRLPGWADWFEHNYPDLTG